MKTPNSLTILLATVATVLSIPALAQWSSDPTVNTAVSTATGGQENPTVVSDGAGGVIITWFDKRGGTFYDIYAQRINSQGVPQWTIDGVAICTAANNQKNPTIASDGAGGAIITWFDVRNGTTSDIYAQRINASGATQWTADGVSICAAANDQLYPKILSDGSGGAIITWDDARAGTSNYDIYAQRVNASGTVQWTANGVAICAAAQSQSSPKLSSDGASGAIITWYDFRSNSNHDIYVQRVNASGAVQWTANGVAICTANSSQIYPDIVADGAGGATIAWQDPRGGAGSDIYAQRVNSSGTVQWTANGVAISTAIGDQAYPAIVADGTGGAIVSWQDSRSSGNDDIYAQCINGSGTVQWTADGVAVCASSGNQWYPAAISDGAGGVIIAWQDSRSGTDIYAQRIDGSAAAYWAANGVAISTATNTQQWPIITSGAGGAIVAWMDYRSGTNWDVYAQDVTLGGSLPIQLSSFRAHLTSTAQQVLLQWTTLSETNNYGFYVQRRLENENDFRDLPTSFVAGHGTTLEPQHYSFTDAAAGDGVRFYRLRQVDLDGSIHYSEPIRVDLVTGVEEHSTPNEFALEQNYPNPFNPTTVIQYSLPTRAQVELRVYNTLGDEVMTLVDGMQDAGRESVTLYANGLASGVYLYRLTAGTFTGTKMLTLVK